MTSHDSSFRWATALLLVMVLGACASKGVRGHTPFVTVNSLQTVGADIELDLGVRNVNSEPIHFGNIQFSLEFGSTSVAVYNAASGVTISASGTENLRFSLATNAESLALLAGLESGETASLAFLLEGEITTSEEAKFKIRREGFLYPVPGRPGQFR